MMSSVLSALSENCEEERSMQELKLRIWDGALRLRQCARCFYNPLPSTLVRSAVNMPLQGRVTEAPKCMRPCGD
jgi:hypothetical protein